MVLDHPFGDPRPTFPPSLHGRCGGAGAHFRAQNYGRISNLEPPKIRFHLSRRILQQQFTLDVIEHFLPMTDIRTNLLE